LTEQVGICLLNKDFFFIPTNSPALLTKYLRHELLRADKLLRQLTNTYFVLSSTEVDDMIRKSTNLLLTRTLASGLESLVDKPSLGLTEVG